METKLINEGIMLARAFSPQGGKRTPADFSQVLNQTVNHATRDENLQPQAFSEKDHAAPPLSSPLVCLGTLTKDTPTVSNILITHPTYGKKCWRIIHDSVNQGKPYNSIPTGTPIYIDPETRELMWGKMLHRNDSSPGNASAESTLAAAAPEKKIDDMPTQSDGSFSSKLVDAVKPYLGKDYNDINCYELIINGLEKMGIKYQGSGGLGHQLIKMAIENGLPINAYFNGEGLIKASGSSIYTKSIPQVTDPQQQAMDIVNELVPMLEKGQILSFSTPTKGHTGIISRNDEMWTYINSGDMDNPVEKRGNLKGVGEENLIEEVINWFSLARSRNEDLRISLGKLNEEKLAAYHRTHKPSTGRV